MFLSIKSSNKICTGLEFALILQPQTGNRTSLTRGADEPGSDKNIDILLPRQAAKVVLRVQGHTISKSRQYRKDNKRNSEPTTI